MIASKVLERTLHAACDAAMRETLPRFRRNGTVQNKDRQGFDPVTDADREAERVIRAVLQERHPGHGIVGEEHGTLDAETEYVWVLDPIDGTRAFVSGLPVWGTLIGLLENGQAIAGAMDQPFTGERFWTAGSGAFLRRNGEDESLATSAVQSLSDATLMTTDPRLFGDRDREGFAKLEHTARMSRYGCDCYAYAMVAAGHIECVAEAGLNSYDIAALIPLVEQAGGTVTTWEGGSASAGGRVLASANPAIHDAALEALNG